MGKLEDVGCQILLGQRTAPNKMKKMVRETSWKVKPAMTMAAPGVTPVVTSSVTETAPPAPCTTNAMTSQGMKTREYSLGLMLKTPRPKKSAIRPIHTYRLFGINQRPLYVIKMIMACSKKKVLTLHS